MRTPDAVQPRPCRPKPSRTTQTEGTEAPQTAAQQFQTDRDLQPSRLDRVGQVLRDVAVHVVNDPLGIVQVPLEQFGSLGAVWRFGSRGWALAWLKARQGSMSEVWGEHHSTGLGYLASGYDSRVGHSRRVRAFMGRG